MSADEVSTAPGLRAWARGSYPIEAAVELLIRAWGGRFAESYQPWVLTTRDGHYRIWTEKLAYESGVFSGGERRLIGIVLSLLDNEDRVALGEAVSGLDRQAMALVLAALAHANGSHEHSDVIVDHAGGASIAYGKAGSLCPWPDEGA